MNFSFPKLLTFIFVLIGSFDQRAFGKTQKTHLLDQIKVCQDCGYKSIQQAIDNIAPNGLIEVHDGSYSEALVIQKPLTLKGIDWPILDGQHTNQIITVKNTENVIIEGFKLNDTGISFVQDIAAVKIIESKKVVIRNNKITKATYAVYLEKSEECTISENEIQGDAKDEASGGNGVHVWTGSNHIIEKNKISGHRDGIYLEFGKGCQVYDNFVSKNIRYGLHFMSSNETVYQRNTFTMNGAGVAVMYSHNIKMIENKFVGNTGPAAYGLLMKEVHASEILNNEILQNTVGIFMEGSNRSHFSENLIKSNGWALRIMGDCENNEFTKNNFIYNSFDVTTNSDHSWNTFSENYWSQYDGYDLNRDGIGDKPYRPVSLSSVISERVDSSYILFNSFFFSIMDAVERVLPSLIPEPLKDEHPLMRPNQAVTK